MTDISFLSYPQNLSQLPRAGSGLEVKVLVIEDVGGISGAREVVNFTAWNMAISVIELLVNQSTT